LAGSQKTKTKKQAFKTWRETSIITRQGVMFRLAALLRQHQGKIAASITKEQGKTLADAEGDVLRGIQVCHYFNLPKQ
jgi:malonate-semialdehyde dehydrogenase (acetylating)/methylmalonate-semialdehyde dehydrogenase